MINTIRLRKWIGTLGMLLPLIVLVLSLIFKFGFPNSISETYYFYPCITPFMIILGAASIILMCYSGYDKQDDIICTLTGLAGLCICLFPCDPVGKLAKDIVAELSYKVGTFSVPVKISGMVHNISAVIFFLLLSYNSLFLFTKTNGNITPWKKKRNFIFTVCGLGMIASLIFIIPVNIFNIFGGTWIIEMIALFFFGISWLTKANTISWLFADPKGD